MKFFIPTIVIEFFLFKLDLENLYLLKIAIKLLKSFVMYKKLCYNVVMKYQISQNEILIEKTPDFNIFDICHCGQLFRYFHLTGYTRIISTNQVADIVEKKDEVQIHCSSSDYFKNYFDLETDYSSIKNSLRINDFMNDAIDFGEGIRILKQDFFETFLSFIVSQNNNIKRIQNSLNRLCQDYGEKIDAQTFAFPTLENLKNANLQYFESIGVGYRAKYLVEFIKNYTLDLQNELNKLSTEKMREQLMAFLGVGEKVADCILLFGLNRKDVFPVDTWIDKVACEYFGMTGKSRSAMSKQLVEKFKNLSGYAQQYLFYYKRELTRKGEKNE